MKRIAWLLIAALAVALASPALAGTTGKCSVSTQACLNNWGKSRERPWAGLKYETDEKGVTTVTAITADGPAAKAGLEVGDVLVELNGIQLANKAVLVKAMGEWTVGTVLTYSVTRAGAEKLIALRLATMPSDVYGLMVGNHMLENHMVAPMAAVSDPATTITVPVEKKK